MRHFKFLIAIGAAFGFSMAVHAKEQLKETAPPESIACFETLTESIKKLDAVFQEISFEFASNIQTRDHFKLVALAAPEPWVPDVKEQVISPPLTLRTYNYIRDLRKELNIRLHASERLKM